jgi:predicted RNase H-like HicB family nuclease
MPRERMVEILTYRAVYEREPDRRWTVRIPSVPGCHSYGRTIAQARERIREALGLFVNDAAAAEIEDDVRLPKSIRRQVQAAKQLREKVTREEREMVVAQRKAVSAMRRLNLGHRDAGQLLGVSFQRAQQLERTPAIHGAIIERGSRTGHSAHVAAKRAAKKR